MQGADSHALKIVALPADRASPPLCEQARPVASEPGIRYGSRKAATIPTWKWAAANLILAQLGVLGVATMAHGQVPSSGQRAAGSGGAEEYGPVRRTGVALYRGRALRYEVINGMAIHDGDIVLGTVEEMVAQHKRSRSTKDPTGSGPVRRDLSAVEDKYLWPDGVIPYVIDPGFTARGLGYIQAAIEEWNSKTVITLVERTTESDFVRFLPEGGCASHLGRRGGEQGIWLEGPDACGAEIHEIGHAVGFHHEHQRVDRDEYIAVSNANMSYAGIAYSPIGGPYDYASTMHYVGFKTIPPGMPLPSSVLSAGDIDGVARLYGKPPTATTISSNPPGLEIIVNGERIVTPATLDWSLGSTHVLEAPFPQTVGSQRFVFGRWNDEGYPRRTVTAGSEST